MAPFRGSRSTRSGRPGATVDADIFDGLPIRQWRIQESLVGSGAAEAAATAAAANPNTAAAAGGTTTTTIPDPFVEDPALSRSDQRPWREPRLYMPKGSEMYQSHSLALLRAARSGRILKHRDSNGVWTSAGATANGTGASKSKDHEKENNDDEGAGTSDERQKGFLARRWTAVPRATERPEREYLAKRRKGLPSLLASAIAIGVLAPSNTAGADDAYGAAPEVTEIRRRAPPPRRKPKKGAKSARKKLADTEGQGVSAAAEHAPGSATNGSATPSGVATASPTDAEQRDTPMKDGGDEEEEEGGDDDDEGEQDEGEGDREEGELTPDAAATVAPEATATAPPPPALAPPIEITTAALSRDVDMETEDSMIILAKQQAATPSPAIDTAPAPSAEPLLTNNGHPTSASQIDDTIVRNDLLRDNLPQPGEAETPQKSVNDSTPLSETRTSEDDVPVSTAAAAAVVPPTDDMAIDSVPQPRLALDGEDRRENELAVEPTASMADTTAIASPVPAPAPASTVSEASTSAVPSSLPPAANEAPTSEAEVRHQSGSEAIEVEAGAEEEADAQDELERPHEESLTPPSPASQPGASAAAAAAVSSATRENGVKAPQPAVERQQRRRRSQDGGGGRRAGGHHPNGLDLSLPPRPPPARDAAAHLPDETSTSTAVKATTTTGATTPPPPATAAAVAAAIREANSGSKAPTTTATDTGAGDKPAADEGGGGDD